MQTLDRLGAKPIASDNPAGADVKYDADFEELKTEIEKLSLPSAEGIRWQRVIDLATTILSQQSKDLFSACYLSIGLLHQDGIRGLSPGVKVIDDMVETYWDILYPPTTRMRGRQGALNWWLDRVDKALEGMEGVTLEAEELAQCKSLLRALDSKLGHHMPEAPSIRRLFNWLDRMAATGTPVEVPSKPSFLVAQEAKAAAPSPSDSSAVTEQESAPTANSSKPSKSSKSSHKVVSANSTNGSEVITDDKDAQRVQRNALVAIRQVAHYYFGNAPEQPLSYRLNRVAAWGGVEKLPVASKQVTKVQPPPEHAKKAVLDLWNAKKFDSLLKAAELKLTQHNFWLDLNFYVYQALDGLGENYHSARDQVARETGRFVELFPDLQDLQFSDGSSFATQECRTWLAGIIRGRAGTSAKTTSKPSPRKTQIKPSSPVAMPASVSHASEFMALIDQCLGMAVEGNLVEAVEALQAIYRESVSPQESFRWRLALAKLLVDSGQSEVAMPHVQAVLDIISRHALEQWDKDLAVQGLEVAWLCFYKHPLKAQSKRAAPLMKRLAKLSPAVALRLDQISLRESKQKEGK